MFKRLVSNLPYSPALIGQVGFYARRLRQEEATRRLGLIFTALALGVQSFAVFSPPEALAATHPSNVVYRGFNSKKQLLQIYDRGSDGKHDDIRQIYNFLGVTRKSLVNTHIATINSRDLHNQIKTIGRWSYNPEKEKVLKVSGANTTVYQNRLSYWDASHYAKQKGTDYKALVGHRDDGSWFAVLFDCGNIAYTNIPRSNPKPAASCESLKIINISRTDFRFIARSSLKNGA